jgi:shikimate kinase
VFREGERRVIARLVDGGARVIASGGGAFIDEATRALILERCIAVWLDADVDTLAERVARRDTRPLLRGRDARATIAALAARRNPIYAEAHVRVRTGRAPHDSAAGRIVEALAARSAG